MVSSYLPLLMPLAFFPGNGTHALGYVNGSAAASSCGSVMIADVVEGSVRLSEGGAVVTLADVLEGSVALSESGAVVSISDALAGSVDLSEDC